MRSSVRGFLTKASVEATAQERESVNLQRPPGSFSLRSSAMKRLPRVSLAAACGFAFALLFPAAAPDARAQGGAAQAPAQTQDGAAPVVNPNDPVSLLGQLNLSPEQTAQMRSIQSESVPQARALNQRLNQARRALDEAIYSDAACASATSRARCSMR